ncbi:MAG: thiamine phosphate synthase [Hyphomonadaceae bacterium]
MRASPVLAAQARRLNRQAGAPAIPSLFFLTDPERTPDPVAVGKHLPRGAAIVFRHFGAADRERVAHRLAALCRVRGLLLLIAADPALALKVGAAGVHWPERLAPPIRTPGFALVTAAAHGPAALSRAAAMQADAAILGPVFATRSAAGNAPLGLFHSSQMARAARLPVIALGGVNVSTARLLSGRGFVGLAAVDGFADA